MRRNCSWSWDIKELDCLVHMMDHRLNTWRSLRDWICIHKLPKNLRLGGNPESVLSFILSKSAWVRGSVNYSQGVNIGGSKIRRDEMLEQKKCARRENFPKSRNIPDKSNRRGFSKAKRLPFAHFKGKINPNEWTLLENSEAGPPRERFQAPFLPSASVSSGSVRQDVMRRPSRVIPLHDQLIKNRTRTHPHYPPKKL